MWCYVRLCDVVTIASNPYMKSDLRFYLCYKSATAPSGLKPIFETIVRPRQMQLHLCHAADNIRLHPQFVCVLLFIKLCGKGVLSKSPKLVLLYKQVSSKSSALCKELFFTQYVWQLGLVTFGSVRSPVNVVVKRGVPWLYSDSLSVNEYRALQRKRKEEECIVPASIKYFCSKHSRRWWAEGKRLEKFEWMRNTRRLLGISVLLHSQE